MQTLLGEITLADDIFKKMVIENPLLVQAVEIAAFPFRIGAGAR